MPAYVQSSDRAPSPGWARDAHRKKPSRTDGERSGASRSLSASAHLRRRAHERPQPGAAPGCNPPFVTPSIGLDPEVHRA